MTDPELRKALETWPEFENLRRLRKAIALWPASIHDQWCNIRADCPCDCGHAQVKEAREAARRLVGLADGDCDCGWEHWCNKCESEHVCGTPCGKEEP